MQECGGFIRRTCTVGDEPDGVERVDGRRVGPLRCRVVACADDVRRGVKSQAPVQTAVALRRGVKIAVDRGLCATAPWGDNFAGFAFLTFISFSQRHPTRRSQQQQQQQQLGPPPVRRTSVGRPHPQPPTSHSSHRQRQREIDSAILVAGGEVEG